MFSFGVTDFPAAKKAPPPPSSIAMDEDAQKRSTDCIYFLASPLTCKKGNACEYRHSEAARTNPRDCRFWKSGNCLNAYCSFRHLPLEGKPASAPVNSTGMAATMAQSVSTASTTAGVGPNKSKTPCYFFSQGYCAKNDKCLFMHGLPVASSPAEVAAQQNLGAGMSGKASHASGRPLIVLKQSGLSSQEVQTVTDGRLEAVNEANSMLYRASGSMQGVPHALERPAHIERVANADLAIGSRHSQNSKKILQNQGNCPGLTQAGNLKDQTSCLSEAVWKVGPSGGGLHQSFAIEEQEYSSPSDSRESQKGLNNPPACNGQDVDCTYGEGKGQRGESEGDLRAHLAKRMKVNSNRIPSRGNGGHLDSAIQPHRGGRLSGHYSKQNKQQQLKTMRGSVMEADVSRDKGAQFNKRSTDLPNEASKQSFKKGQSRSLAIKQQKVDQPKTHYAEAALMPEKGVQVSSSLRSKRSISGAVKETLAFTGPKSLAQIKAEKMAKGESASKAVGRLNSSSIISESSSKLADRKLVAPVASRDAAAANQKVLSTHLGFVSTAKKDDTSKHEMESLNEFDGPKPLSALLKRKRESESGGNVKESTLGPIDGQVHELKSFSEREDGEFCDDDDNLNVDSEDDACALVSFQEDLVVASPSNAKEEVSERLERLSGEPDEFETESSEDELKFDGEMEENGYGGEDYELDDDDEDEDDFAKKLGRVFGLSNE